MHREDLSNVPHSVNGAIAPGSAPWWLNKHIIPDHWAEYKNSYHLL